MSDDCNHGHTSYSEESYFYKETKRLVEELRHMAASANLVTEQTPILAPVKMIMARAA